MAIDGSGWCERFKIEWASDWPGPGLTDEVWRVKIMDGGVLLFETETGGSFVAAPHTWTRLKVSSVDLGELKASGWCDNFAGWAEGEKHFGSGYRVKLLGGGMLLLEEKTTDGEFLVVAPQSWTALKAAFDFTE